jgi:hypothetical protein
MHTLEYSSRGCTEETPSLLLRQRNDQTLSTQGRSKPFPCSEERLEGCAQSMCCGTRRCALYDRRWQCPLHACQAPRSDSGENGTESGGACPVTFSEVGKSGNRVMSYARVAYATSCAKTYPFQGTDSRTEVLYIQHEYTECGDILSRRPYFAPMLQGRYMPAASSICRRGADSSLTRSAHRIPYSVVNAKFKWFLHHTWPSDGRLSLTCHHSA